MIVIGHIMTWVAVALFLMALLGLIYEEFLEDYF